MDQVKFVKDCLPQILLDPFLNTLFHLVFSSLEIEKRLKSQIFKVAAEKNFFSSVHVIATTFFD